MVGTTVISGASDGVNAILMGLSGTNRTTIQLDTADTTHTNRQWGITNIAGDLFIGRHGLSVMTMKNDGSVGIGTSTPAVSSKLHLKKASAGTPHYDSFATQIIEDTEARLQLMSNDGGNNAASFLLSNEDKHWGIHNHGTSSAHRFAIGYYDSSSNGDFIDAQEDIFNIKTNGDIGMGTQSPASELDIAGVTPTLTISDITRHEGAMYTLVEAWS